jgi:hypothetical protein
MASLIVYKSDLFLAITKPSLINLPARPATYRIEKGSNFIVVLY